MAKTEFMLPLYCPLSHPLNQQPGRPVPIAPIRLPQAGDLINAASSSLIPNTFHINGANLADGQFSRSAS